MSEIYSGDEWKRVKSPEDKPTRAQEQSRIDIEYCNGRMERDEWIKRTDELSDISKWNASGKIPSAK